MRRVGRCLIVVFLVIYLVKSRKGKGNMSKDNMSDEEIFGGACNAMFAMDNAAVLGAQSNKSLGEIAMGFADKSTDQQIADLKDAAEIVKDVSEAAKDDVVQLIALSLLPDREETIQDAGIKLAVEAVMSGVIEREDLTDHMVGDVMGRFYEAYDGAKHYMFYPGDMACDNG